MTPNWYHTQERALSLLLRIIHFSNKWTLSSSVVELQRATIIFIFEINGEVDHPMLYLHFSFIITAGHLLMCLIRKDTLSKPRPFLTSHLYLHSAGPNLLGLFE